MVKQGEIIYLNFNPQSGHEQKGKRPAIVVSNDIFNKTNNLTLVCPITNSEPKTPLQISLDKKLSIKGTILCDQVKSLDIESRKYTVVDKVSEETIEEVIDILQGIIER